MNKFEKEIMVELLTKYINRRLKNDVRVKDWAFSVTLDGKYSLNVQIDYVNDFHSRDMFLIEQDYDLKYLQMTFEFYFEKHLKELEKLEIERINSQWAWK